MDDKVNDFLNEINEIAPPEAVAEATQEVWKQCYDELTGYVYYWNKNTDKVTWTPPESFKEATSKPIESKKDLHIPKVEPLIPNLVINSKVKPKDIKIYSIEGNSNKLPQVPKVQKRAAAKRSNRKDSDSEDEKITLISSYGTDSESETEYRELKKSKIEEESSPIKSENNNSDEDDDIDLLAKIQKRAQELQALGGDIPAEIKNVVENSKSELLKTRKSIMGVSLVAGYSDSEEENEETKTVLQSKEQPQISHSTLFPITTPININDFKLPVTVETNTNVDSPQNFDNKAFQRKRRIGIALLNTGKRNSEKGDNEEENRKGLGFETNVTSDNVYAGLKKDGITFVKSETLNSLVTSNTQENSLPVQDIDKSRSLEVINDMYSTLKEKLIFLNEGRPDISPVQSMLIQAETLFVAMTDEALKPSYLQKWLKETCSELIKLEKAATPAGWVLRWDKSHKRYFYQNLNSGESQWEYPQPDIGNCDDAMDISTTPPHVDAEPNVPMSPPLPPTISSPTPPPPPIISIIEPEVNFNEVPLPKESGPRNLIDSIVQPLPPGVDSHEITNFVKLKDTSEKKDHLNSALDSFYSDIAAISASPPPTPSNEELISDNCNAEIKPDILKKKKKMKVKLAPGLAMKKKGVNKLVEKWKNLRQEYN